MRMATAGNAVISLQSVSCYPKRNKRVKFSDRFCLETVSGFLHQIHEQEDDKAKCCKKHTAGEKGA
jgi:hypothetical protein